MSALTILKSDQEYANKTELGYILLPFYFTSHNHFLLWEQAQDCTPLITYHDKKKLKCQGFFFLLWLSLISDTFLMQYVCQAFPSCTMARLRSCESAKTYLKRALFFVKSNREERLPDMTCAIIRVVGE